jgi:hypothetical protein
MVVTLMIFFIGIFGLSFNIAGLAVKFLNGYGIIYLHDHKNLLRASA